MNNHRANIKSLKPQFLYKHFTSDGHKLEDMFVQPIESIAVPPNEQASTYSKRVEREEFWIRELKTVYPYGLNDNIRGVAGSFLTSIPRLGTENQNDPAARIPKNPLTLVIGLKTNLVITNPCVSYINTLVQFSGLETPFSGIPGHSLKNNSISIPSLLISF